MSQRLACLLRRDARRRPLRNDIDILRLPKRSLVTSEKLPDAPFDPVPGDRSPHLFGDGDAQPRAGVSARRADGDKVSVLNLVTDIRQCQEFGSSADALHFFERLPRHTPLSFPPHAVVQSPKQALNGDGSLQRQSLSALGSPALDDPLAGFGGHAFQKSVVSGSSQSAWLICSFHLIPLLMVFA